MVWIWMEMDVVVKVWMEMDAAVKELKENGLINGKKNGKIIVYYLTEKGRSDVKEATAYFYRSFKNILEEESSKK